MMNLDRTLRPQDVEVETSDGDFPVPAVGFVGLACFILLPSFGRSIRTLVGEYIPLSSFVSPVSI